MAHQTGERYTAFARAGFVHVYCHDPAERSYRVPLDKVTHVAVPRTGSLGYARAEDGAIYELRMWNRKVYRVTFPPKPGVSSMACAGDGKSDGNRMSLLAVVAEGLLSLFLRVAEDYCVFPDVLVCPGPVDVSDGLEKYGNLFPGVGGGPDPCFLVRAMGPNATMQLLAVTVTAAAGAHDSGRGDAAGQISVRQRIVPVPIVAPPRPAPLYTRLLADGAVFWVAGCILLFLGDGLSRALPFVADGEGLTPTYITVFSALVQSAGGPAAAGKPGIPLPTAAAPPQPRRVEVFLVGCGNGQVWAVDGASGQRASIAAPQRPSPVVGLSVPRSGAVWCFWADGSDRSVPGSEVVEACAR